MTVTAPIAEYQMDPDAELDFPIWWGAEEWANDTEYVIGHRVRDGVTGFYYISKELHTTAASPATFAQEISKWKKTKPLWLDNDASPAEIVETSDWAIVDTEGGTPTLIIDTAKPSSGKEILLGGAQTRVWLKSGTDERTYEVTNRIIANGNKRKTDRTILIKVGER